MYVAGPPCQPVSQRGKGLGVDDRRGQEMMRALEYVKRAHPDVVVLENVKGLVDRHRDFLSQVLQSLVKEGYRVAWSIMHTAEHGIPHSRARLYILAIMRTWRGFDWPQTLKVKNIAHHFLDHNRSASSEPLKTQTAKRNLDAARDYFMTKGVDPEVSTCLVDLQAANSHANNMAFKMPCLTASHGAMWASA